MANRKTVNCKYCGMGHAPRADGDHWIVKSIIPARIDIRECAYHKAGLVSPIQMIEIIKEDSLSPEDEAHIFATGHLPEDF
jgi:hypothetical protein